MHTELEILTELLQLADKSFPSPITYTEEEVSITVKWNSSADLENPQNTFSKVLGIQPEGPDWNLPEVTATFHSTSEEPLVIDPLELTRGLAWQLVSETTNNDPSEEAITAKYGHFDNIPEDEEEPTAVITVKILDWFS